MKRFFIVAGETSGDLHAARLMQQLRAVWPDCEFRGIGGPRMQALGLKSLAQLEDINVVGFWEVAKRYPFFRRLLRRCRAELEQGGCDAFIPVDYPGFNLRLAAAARKAGIPVLYYIAPQLWAWGEKRAAKLRAAVDLLMVVFPFEVEFFGRFGIEARFVGHPLLDVPAFREGEGEAEREAECIALLPGSRNQEVENNLPIMLEAAKLLQATMPQLRFVVAAAGRESSVHDRLIQAAAVDVEITHDSRALLKRAAAGMVKTGTSTLESALARMPFVMMYRTSALSYRIARRLITLPFISLVNIIAGKQVVRELIQDEARPDLLAEELRRLLGDSAARLTMLHEFDAVRAALGEGGAAARQAAECIAEYLEPQRSRRS